MPLRSVNASSSRIANAPSLVSPSVTSCAAGQRDVEVDRAQLRVPAEHHVAILHQQHLPLLVTPFDHRRQMLICAPSFNSALRTTSRPMCGLV